MFKSQLGKDEMEKLLSSLPFFREFSRKDLSLLFPIVHTRLFGAGEYIYRQGDPGIAFYIIQEGEVRFEKDILETDRTNPGSLNKDDLPPGILTGKILKRGSYFGELALVDDRKRLVSAAAVSDSRIAVIFRPDLDDFISRYPKKGVSILKALAVLLAEKVRNCEDNL